MRRCATLSSSTSTTSGVIAGTWRQTVRSVLPLGIDDSGRVVGSNTSSSWWPAGRLRARQRSRTLRWRRRARDQRILRAAQVSSSRRGHASCADALQTLPGPVGAGRTHVECCGTALLASLDQALRDRGGRGAPTPPWRPRLLCAALRDGQVICVEGAAFLGSWEMISRVKLSALPLPASRAPSPPPRDPPRRGPRPGRRRRVAPPGR